MNRTFLLVGPPGSGKSEQAKRLVAASGMTHVPMGSLIRHYCDQPRPGNICDEITKNYQAGIPQSDEVSLQILFDKLRTIDTSKGIIFDAFPLSLGEAEHLEEILKEFSLDEPIVIHIDVDEETAVARIVGRKVCSVCGRASTPDTTSYQTDVCDTCGGTLNRREDDQEEIVRLRYKEYEQRIKILLEYYRTHGYPIVSYPSGSDGPQADFDVLVKKLGDIDITL